MTFKLAVKTIAQKNGLHATFMPKPIYGISGSGMHTNMSLFKDGENIFFDPNGEKKPKRHIALLREFSTMLEVWQQSNPLINSYKRLVPGYKAPCYISWSSSNRSALIRIPSSRGKSTRVELRSPDPACNPYLTIAACLAAGLDGIEKNMTPPAEITDNIFEMSSEEREEKNIGNLPGSLHEAIAEFENDEVIKGLGDHIVTQYIAGKNRECEEYNTRVSSWEIEKYIFSY